MENTISDCVELFRRGAWQTLCERLDGVILAHVCPRVSPEGWRFLYLRALVHAARGQYGECVADADLLEAEGRHHDLPDVVALAVHVRALLSLSLGHPEFALMRRTGCTGAFPPGRLGYPLLDLVEVAIRLGADDVERLLSSAATPAGQQHRVRREFAGALADVSERRISCFRTVLTTPELDHLPFEAARIRLALGEELRRGGSVVEAREHLVLARETFRALGATPWRERCDGELRASGLGVLRRRDSHPNTLTAQERRIAELAASGMSNREIGHRLYLSPRTVGAHLYHAFPKLGVATRAALRDALTVADHLAT